MSLVAPMRVSFILAACICLVAGPPVSGASNGLASSPPLGWSSWSALETGIDENTIKAIAERQAALLKPYGYRYVNVDGGWYLNPDLGIDANGRWMADPAKFPSGMRALGDSLHALGLKFGLYVTPGIPKLAVTRKTPVAGTTFNAADIALTAKTEVTYLGGTMYSLDYSKPGSQAFINSWANLFAEWGVDYLKIDAIRNQNVPDVQAWSAALLQTGRPIHLALANELDPSYSATWRQYANGWRISTDIESYNGSTLTSWAMVALRFALAPNWLSAGGPGGWNDLDSLEIGGANTGLSADERQTMASFWSLSASPLLIGDDLRNLDALGVKLLTNPGFLQIDQNGVVAAPVNASRMQQVWAALQPDGAFAVGLFNLGDTAAPVEVSWSSLGFTGAASVQDVWASFDLGPRQDSFRAQLNPHASQLLLVRPKAIVAQLRAGQAALANGAVLRSSTVGAQGQRAALPVAGSSLTFSSVNVACGGVYDVTLSYVNGDRQARHATLSINGTGPTPLVFQTAGNWTDDLTEQGVSAAIPLVRGANTLSIANSGNPAPELIGITLQLRNARKLRTGHLDCGTTF